MIRQRGLLCIRVRFGLVLFFLILQIAICSTRIGVSHRSGLGGLDDPCKDPVNLCHSEGSILLMSFPQPPRQCVHG